MSFLGLATETIDELELRKRREIYKNDPVLWAKEVGGYHMWSTQAEVAMSVANNKNTAVKAGHGVGKSWLAAILICWWIDTRYPYCFAASTAPSAAQIGAIVWREIHNIRAQVEKRHQEFLERQANGQSTAGLPDHKIPGYITSDHYWKTDDGVLVGFGRKPPDQKTDDAFQGIHAPEGVLAVGDEAVGLTEEMIDALGNITTSANDRRLVICNPTNPASHVGKLFKNKPKNWNFFTISVLKSPNFTSERAETPPEVLKALSDETFVDSKREEYGEGSPRWISRIEGEFAWDMGFTLFRAEDLAKAYDVDIIPSYNSKPVLGVDVSRSKSGDKNTVYKYHDGRLRFVEEWNDPNAIGTAQKIHDLAIEHAVIEVRIDGVGIGGPIADYVRELALDSYLVIEVLGGDSSPDIQRWANFRAWSYWSFQDRMSKGLIDVELEDDTLSEQLLGMELKKRTSGRDNMLLESKEDMRKRGVHSPDHADAASYAVLDLSPWTGNPYNQLPVGSAVAMDREDVMPDFTDFAMRGGGIPLF